MIITKPGIPLSKLSWQFRCFRCNCGFTATSSEVTTFDYSNCQCLRVDCPQCGHKMELPFDSLTPTEAK